MAWIDSGRLKAVLERLDSQGLICSLDDVLETVDELEEAGLVPVGTGFRWEMLKEDCPLQMRF